MPDCRSPRELQFYRCFVKLCGLGPCLLSIFRFGHFGWQWRFWWQLRFSAFIDMARQARVVRSEFNYLCLQFPWKVDFGFSCVRLLFAFVFTLASTLSFSLPLPFLLPVPLPLPSHLPLSLPLSSSLSLPSFMAVPLPVHLHLPLALPLLWALLLPLPLPLLSLHD